MQRLALSIALLLMAALVVGCGSDSSSTSGSSEVSEPFRIPIPGGKAPIRYESKIKVGPNGLAGQEPKPSFPKGSPPDFLALADLIEGIGKLSFEGKQLTVQYVGYDYDTHEKFASSWEEGKPFTFTLGKGEAIKGWEEGLPELEGGDRREMVIPPSETSGPFPKGIPKGHTVIFVVEPLPAQGAKSNKQAASKPTEESGQSGTASGKKPKVEVPSGPPPKKLETKDLKQGSGPAAKSGDEVTVQYVGVNYKTGKEFDASWDRGEPFTFQLGSNSVIKGWEQGIQGMKAGGRRELIIPPQLAYGSQSTGTIPANETLVFVVDLEAIN